MTSGSPRIFTFSNSMDYTPLGATVVLSFASLSSKAPTGGDSGRKVMPTACSRASTPTSGARSVSEWGCILPVRRAGHPCLSRRNGGH